MTATVKLVFRLDATKTRPLSVPMADPFCMVTAAYGAGLSGPGIVPVVFMGSSQLEMERFVFVLPIVSVMKEKTSERVLWDVTRRKLREGRKWAA